jgi:hypothetical protein
MISSFHIILNDINYQNDRAYLERKKFKRDGWGKFISPIMQKNYSIIYCS